MTRRALAMGSASTWPVEGPADLVAEAPSISFWAPLLSLGTAATLAFGVSDPSCEAVGCRLLDAGGFFGCLLFLSRGLFRFGFFFRDIFRRLFGRFVAALSECWRGQRESACDHGQR